MNDCSSSFLCGRGGEGPREETSIRGGCDGFLAREADVVALLPDMAVPGRLGWMRLDRGALSSSSSSSCELSESDVPAFRAGCRWCAEMADLDVVSEES